MKTSGYKSGTKADAITNRLNEISIKASSKAVSEHVHSNYENKGVDIYVQESAPSNPNIGDLWFDIS